ncbi:GNAT family N-acetyltransferase [Mycobacterium riyadhense]|nr:GNAT family N-acetyltransferase [Mycobacterium riyadhense]
MKIHMLQGPPLSDLARALDIFEEQFSYPLGPDSTFRISHGDDYTRFFRAMGEAVVFVAENDGQVLGTVAAALRSLMTPDGHEKNAVYLGDVKISPAARRGLTPLRLMRALLAEAAHRSRIEGIFSVLMDGTELPQTPEAYSRRAARLGLPVLRAVGHITILRVPTSQLTDATTQDGDPARSVSLAAVAELYRRLTQGHYAVPAGQPMMRSELPPAALMLSDDSACGLLEDTRRAKLLYTAAGELRGAHLSNFAYRDPERGAALVKAALSLAAKHGNPELTFAIPVPDTAALVAHLCIPGTGVYQATVNGADLAAAERWSINTAEI